MNGFTLDFYDILVNELIGDLTLFLIIGCLVIIFFSLKKNIPMVAASIFCMLLILIINIKTAFPALFVLVIFIVGLLFFLAIGKLWRLIN